MTGTKSGTSDDAKKTTEDAEKARDDKTTERESPTAASAASASAGTATMPLSQNNSRPPSATSVSRRGGRRSRSPPAMRGGGFPPSLDTNGDGSNNPSSAAAAAAAAAQAFGHPHRSGAAEGEPTKFPSNDAGYDVHYHGSRSWPVDDQDRPRRSGSYGNSQSIHRLPPSGSDAASADLYGRHHGPAGSYGNEYRGGGRPGSMHPSYEDDRYGSRDGRNHSMSPHSDGRYGQPYYRGPPPGSDGRSSPKDGPPRSGSSGGMSRVMGTATPIHVPRASESSSQIRHSRSGTPASVFRGRPSIGESASNAARGDEARNEDDNPQKILLSLRTPTTSFDEKQPANKNGKMSADLPPSPDEPPQIQLTHNQKDFFDPTQSPKAGSIAMAPSFNLFNQSFDSFGDTFNVVGNLDASLQSASFGTGPTASGEFGTVGSNLQRSLSGGNYAQQLLGSSSGGLTFGMSPVNSFGNGPSAAPPSRRGGSTMMVLGGQDARSASPTQVLGMYHSYSGGGGGSQGMLRPNNSMGPLEDSHLRLSATSFGGAPSLSQNYTRSFGAEGSSTMPYNGRMAHYHDGEGGQLFYIFLKRHKAAFSHCTFLLPGLKAALLEGLDNSKAGDDNMKPSMYPEPSPQETSIAQRRVTSAVCAFGGTPAAENPKSSSGQSIFREKGDAPTVTPSSSSSGPSGGKSRAKAKYDEALPTRYYENESRLSWEFEENPPVESLDADDFEKSKATPNPKPEQTASNNSSTPGENRNNGEGIPKSDSSSDPPLPSTPSKSDRDKSKNDSATSPSSGSDTPKMRYRCKLCGQPKQNHTCPFMQSLARSIGVMVYPSVNAFTAAEPGVIAPPLTEMNNFVNPDDASVADSKSSIPSPDRRHLTGPNGSTQVTPESRRSSKSNQITSPTSTISAGSGSPHDPRTPGSAARRTGASPGMGSRTPGSASSRRSRKRRHGQMENDQGDLLFVEPMELKQEQFRIVTPSKITSSGAYQYAALPLPYAQRKRLSDNLFSLSQKIPQLTKECSAVLREAREKDMWDLAVAELMTQVVVVSHCHEADSRFDGLRQYLLTLGIAC